MSDKYEEWIREHPKQVQAIADIASVKNDSQFRTAIKMAIEYFDSRRAAETCETCEAWARLRLNNGYGSCAMLGILTRARFGCISYSRRIVEKQGGK